MSKDITLILWTTFYKLFTLTQTERMKHLINTSLVKIGFQISSFPLKVTFSSSICIFLGEPSLSTKAKVRQNHSKV